MRRARVLTLALTVAGASVPASAQITVTEADVRDQMAVGKSVTNYTDTLTAALDIGAPGPTSWDFSGLFSHTAQTLLSVEPSTTPYASQFPGSTFAFQTQVSVSGITATAYLYLVLSTNLLNPGVMGGTPTFLGQLELKRVNTPSDVIYALPSTFGSSWISAYAMEETITLGPSTVSSTTRTHSVAYLADAYGPMTIPGGFTYDALRIRKVDTLSTGISAGYIFLAKNGASVQITAADHAAPTSGVIAVSSVTWNGAVPTDVRDTEPVASEYALRQSYPNPFNPSTTIEFSLPRHEHVSLRVFNTLGEEMASPVDGTRGPGVVSVLFDAADLPSGVYIYRLQAGRHVEARTMTLVR